MTRLLVIVLGGVFIVGFGYFTFFDVVEQGVSVGVVLSVLILVLIGLGVVGALRNPPP